VVLVVIQVALAGCSASPAKAAKPTATTPHVTPTPQPYNLNGPFVTAQQAWGNVHIIHLTTDMGNNLVFISEQVASPDGQWLVGSIEPRTFPNVTNALSSIALYNVHTSRVVRVHTLLNPLSQVLSASIDDHWLVWSEADDNPTFYDWTMFAYNRQTGQVTKLGQAVRVNGQPIAGSYLSPVVSQDEVIWSEPIAPVVQNDSSTLKNNVTYLENLAAGTVTTLATAAIGAYLELPWALWGTYTPSGSGYILFKNLVTGEVRQLQQEPATIVIHGTSAAYDDSNSVYLIDDFTKTPVTGVQIAAPTDAAPHLEFVTLDDRFVAWRAQTGTPTLYDRIHKRIIRLATYPDFSNASAISDPILEGGLIVWPDPVDVLSSNGLQSTTLNIIDTRTLPA